MTSLTTDETITGTDGTTSTLAHSNSTCDDPIPNTKVTTSNIAAGSTGSTGSTIVTNYMRGDRVIVECKEWQTEEGQTHFSGTVCYPNDDGTYAIHFDNGEQSVASDCSLMIRETPRSEVEELTPDLIRIMRLQGSDFWHNLFEFMYDLHDDLEGREIRFANSYVENLRFLCKTFAQALPPPDYKYILVVGLNNSDSDSVWDEFNESGKERDSGAIPCRTMEQALSVVVSQRERNLKKTMLRKKTIGDMANLKKTNTHGALIPNTWSMAHSAIISEIRVAEGTIGDMDWLREWSMDPDVQYDGGMFNLFGVKIQINNLRIKGAGIGKTIYYGSFFTKPMRKEVPCTIVNSSRRTTREDVDFKGIVICDMTITNPFGSAATVVESGSMKMERCEITGCNQGVSVGTLCYSSYAYDTDPQFCGGSTYDQYNRTTINKLAQASLELSDCHIHHNRREGVKTSWNEGSGPWHPKGKQWSEQTHLKLTDCEIDHNGGIGVYCFDAVVDIYGDKTDIHHNRKQGCRSILSGLVPEDEDEKEIFSGISIHRPTSPCHDNSVHVHLDNPMSDEIELDDDAGDANVKAIKPRPSSYEDYNSEPSEDEDEDDNRERMDGPCGTYCHEDAKKHALCGCGQSQWVRHPDYWSWEFGDGPIFTGLGHFVFDHDAANLKIREVNKARKEQIKIREENKARKEHTRVEAIARGLGIGQQVVLLSSYRKTLGTSGKKMYCSDKNESCPCQSQSPSSRPVIHIAKVIKYTDGKYANIYCRYTYQEEYANIHCNHACIWPIDDVVSLKNFKSKRKWCKEKSFFVFE